MNETIKTALYVLVAVVVSAAAVVTYPKQEAFVLPDLVGKVLFEDFTDPEAAAELHILTFREDLGEFSEFEVARDLETGLWVIPSSGNYPADADAQMRDAATSLIDLKVIGEASTLASEHETYGVIEPKRQRTRQTDYRQTCQGKGRFTLCSQTGHRFSLCGEHRPGKVPYRV